MKQRTHVKVEDARTQEAGIAASDYLKRLRDEARGIARVNDALDDYKRKVADYNKANPESKVSPGQMAADMAEIRKKYSDRSGASDANRIRKSLLDAALQETKNSLELIQNAYKNADDQLQALHKATLISDHAFYAAQIALVDDTTSKKIDAYEREKRPSSRHIGKHRLTSAFASRRRSARSTRRLRNAGGKRVA